MGSSSQRKTKKKRRKKRIGITGKAKYSNPSIPTLEETFRTFNSPRDLVECLFFMGNKLMDRYTTYFLAREYSKKEAIKSSNYSLRNFAHWLKYSISTDSDSIIFFHAMGFILQ